jgi:hypothetical protein
MLPLSDGIPARRYPIVNVLLIEANFGLFNARANGAASRSSPTSAGSSSACWQHGPCQGGTGRTPSNGAPWRCSDDAGADRPRIRYSQY